VGFRESELLLTMACCRELSCRQLQGSYLTLLDHAARIPRSGGHFPAVGRVFVGFYCLFLSFPP
jgi:hypothetical protein